MLLESTEKIYAITALYNVGYTTLECIDRSGYAFTCVVPFTMEPHGVMIINAGDVPPTAKKALCIYIDPDNYPQLVILRSKWDSKYLDWRSADDLAYFEGYNLKTPENLPQGEGIFVKIP